MWHLRRRRMSHVMSYDLCPCRMRLLKSRMWHHVMSLRWYMISHFQAILDIIPFGRHPNVTCDVIWCHFEVTWHDIPGVMWRCAGSVPPPVKWSRAGLFMLCIKHISCIYNTMAVTHANPVYMSHVMSYDTKMTSYDVTCDFWAVTCDMSKSHMTSHVTLAAALNVTYDIIWHHVTWLALCTDVAFRLQNYS